MVGTLRDQLLYPVPPARVWNGSVQSDKQLFTSIAGEEPKYSNLDDGELAGSSCCPYAVIYQFWGMYNLFLMQMRLALRFLSDFKM